MDQCTHCTMRGNLKGCLETTCNQHESWMVRQLKAEHAALKYSLQLDEELIGKIQQVISVLASRPVVTPNAMCTPDGASTGI